MNREGFLKRVVAGTKSLRFRLTLWMTGAVAVTTLLVLVGIREGVRRTLIGELDQILIEDLREIRLAIADARNRGSEGDETWYRRLQGELDQEPWDARDEFREEFNFFERLDDKVRGHEAHDWFVRLWDDQGKLIVGSPEGPAGFQAGSGRDLVPFGVDGYRVVDLRLKPPWGRIAGVRIGASIELIEADMSRIDATVEIIAGAVLLAAPLCTYWLAGRALRPVGAIIDTASRLRPNRLDERLPTRRAGDELDKLAITINGLLDRIAVHLRERRDFLANSAHELRSPLAAMRSTVEVALQSGRISTEDEETFAVVIDQCRSLEYLVNQLLLIAETEAERLTVRREEIRLDRLVATAIDMFSAAAEMNDVRLVEGDLHTAVVHGNRGHLRQVVNNLLDNAVKFTPPGGVVTVSLRRTDDGQAVLAVADTGIGIAAEDLPRVFDRFFRSDRSRTRDGRGTGLGLSIVQAVVAAHGGTIVVESEAGAGATFTVSLPTAEPIKPPLETVRGPFEGAGVTASRVE